MITNLTDLADRLKGITVNGEELTPEKFMELAKAEDEHEIKLTEGKYLSTDDLDELKVTVKQNGYEEGKTAGSEMTIKDIKKAKGLDFEGKTIPTLIKYYDEKVMSEAGKEPTEKITELTGSLENLQKKYDDDSLEWEEKFKLKDIELQNVNSNSFMSGLIPTIEGFKKNHLLASFKSDGYGVAYNESGVGEPTLNGKVIKTDMEKVKPFTDVVNDWVQENQFIQTKGRGGNNTPGTPGGTFKTMNDLMKHMDINKIDPLSSQGLEMIDRFEKSQEAA